MSKKNKNKIKNEIKCLLNNIKFKSINLTLSKQIIIIWIIITLISLFFPWVIDTNKNILWNSFASLSWNIGYILLLILFFSLFIIFSTNYKDKLKLYSNISVKNHFFIITSAFIIISFNIVAVSFINWLNTFFESLTYWNWVILSMTWWFIMLIWWFLLRKEYYSNSSEIILNKLNQNREQIKKEDNMKLPF